MSDFSLQELYSKNTVIIILLVLLVLLFLGINVLIYTGNLFQASVDIFGPVVYDFFRLLGYSSGTLINKSADVISGTARLGIDIGDGVAHDVGNILKSDTHLLSTNDLSYRRIDDNDHKRNEYHRRDDEYRRIDDEYRRIDDEYNHHHGTPDDDRRREEGDRRRADDHRKLDDAINTRKITTSPKDPEPMSSMDVGTLAQTKPYSRV